MGPALDLGSVIMYIDGKPIGEISNDREFFETISEDGDSIDPGFSVPFPEMEITLSAKINEKLMDRLYLGPCKRWRLRRKAIRRRNIANRRKDYGKH
jgi:hypothetical protein